MGPARDEAARLEQALARIARAASQRPPGAAEAAPRHTSHPAPLHAASSHATTRAGPADTADIAVRLDSLIAELRALLGQAGD